MIRFKDKMVRFNFHDNIRVRVRTIALLKHYYSTTVALTLL